MARRTQHRPARLTRPTDDEKTWPYRHRRRVERLARLEEYEQRLVALLVRVRQQIEVEVDRILHT